MNSTNKPLKKRILTGMKPTGNVHLGNYFGAILPAVELSLDPSYEVLLLCVDWHGLTNRKDILTPGQMTHEIISTYLALGFNLKDNAILLQSDFSQIQEISWYLSCATGVGLLERAHAYKDALASGKDPTAGLLYYTVLMSSDILTFGASAVPVGKDQLQHLEFASDMAKSFNHITSQQVFLEPIPMVQKDSSTLLGTDGRKMSKSYQNTIPIFASKKQVEKYVKDIKTDGAGLHDPKNPENCLVFQLFQSFASSEAVAYMRDRLLQGTNYGYGHAKQDFLMEFERVFSEKRKHFEHYLQHPEEVKLSLQEGYERAFTYADGIVKKARQALGLKNYFLKD